MYACPDFIDTQTKKQKIYFRKGVKQNEEILKTISIMRSSSSSYSCSRNISYGISATYAPADATHETATLTIDASGYTAAQKTLLVLKPGVTLDKIDVDKGDVLQIDQKDGNDSIAVALPKNLADGKYTVYMGGDGQVYSTNFKVGTGTDEEYIVGDSNSDGKIRTGDANAILWYTVDDKAVDGKSFNVGETVTGQLAE